MCEHIRKVRKALDLTQQEFADRLGVKRGTVATYERGKSNPSDAAVILICKTFNVSEEWLRTGEGEMFKQTDERAVSKLCEELHATPLEVGIIRAYFRIDPEIRDSFMSRLIEEVQLESKREPIAFTTFADRVMRIEDEKAYSVELDEKYPDPPKQDGT